MNKLLAAGIGGLGGYLVTKPFVKEDSLAPFIVGALGALGGGAVAGTVNFASGLIEDARECPHGVTYSNGVRRCTTAEEAARRRPRTGGITGGVAPMPDEPIDVTPPNIATTEDSTPVSGWFERAL